LDELMEALKGCEELEECFKKERKLREELRALHIKMYKKYANLVKEEGNSG